MSAKYRIGNLVEFSESSYQNDEDYYDLDVSQRYTEGQQGYILDVKEGDDGYVYKIQVGLTNILDVPESHIFDPNSTIRSRVEDRLREKQETKTFRDTEGRIGGSKKEKAAWRLVAGQVYTLNDLDKIEEADEKLAIELIKKDTVYPKVDVASQRENGIGSGAVFLKVKLRESYPSKVPTKSAQRKIYVGFAEYLYKKTVDIYTTNDFINFVERVLLKETIGEFIKILKPDLIENIEAQKEENERLLTELTDDLKRLEAERQIENTRLQTKYPELVLDHYPFFDLKSVPEHDKIKKERLTNQINDINEQRSKYRRVFSDLEKEFLQQLSPSSTNAMSSEWAAKKLLQEIFGSTFLNFVTKGSQAATKNYELAVDYDALSKTESQILIENKSESRLIRKQSIEDEINKINSLVSEIEFDDFFEKRGSSGYHQSIFGETYKGKGKWYYYKDLKSKDYKKIYANRYANNLKNSLNDIDIAIEEIKKKYRERDNDWSWYSSEKTSISKEKSKEKLKVNTYPPLLHIKRTGGYLITEDNLMPTTIEKDGVKFNEYPILKNNFGFKEIEFGQSLKDREAKEHVKHFLAAIADLGDILDLNIKKLNQLGGLSISFASRGSGKATATYTALRRIINITKTRGGGAVAHEYLHYIDNIIPSINRSGYEHNQWASVKDSTQKRWYGSRVIRNISNEDVSKSVTNIFNYIDERLFPNENGGSSEIGKRPIIKKTVQAYKGDNNWQIPTVFYVGSATPIKPTEIDEYFKYFKQRFIQYKYLEKLSKKNSEVLGTIVQKFGLEEYDFEFEAKTSQYLANSIVAGDYWSREWELFARGFETYIYDKLAKANRSNTYLVAGFYFGEEYAVYPFGEEREKLFILYDAFIDAIKKAYDLSGFVSWTNERVDEYFAVDSKTDEESGIVVNDETNEVLEEVGEANTLKPKLRELLSILSDNKMELGGSIESSQYFDKLNDYLVTL